MLSFKIRIFFDCHAVKLASKIFDTITFPILSYCSEVWSDHVAKYDFQSWNKIAGEKVHLRFCKLYLEVNRKASNISSKSKLARFPLQAPLLKRILEYYIYLKENNDNSIVQQPFIMSKELGNSGVKSYTTVGYDNEMLLPVNSHFAEDDLESLTQNKIIKTAEDFKTV